MAIGSGNKKVEDVGTWQEIFKPVRSERIEKAR